MPSPYGSNSTPKVSQIVLIESDEAIAERARLVLERYFGQSCVTLVRSIEELKKVDVAEMDMVLTEMSLPDATGMQVLDYLRGYRQDLPIVLITDQTVVSLAVEAIRRGASDYIVKAGDYIQALPVVIEKNMLVWHTKRENETLQVELARRIEEIHEKNQQLKAAIVELAQVAATDPMTGLANRREFNEVLTREFKKCVDGGHDLTCVMIDVDRFKIFNDTLGHLLGDELLILTAHVLRTHCRRLDIAGRYGGDEFVLLLPASDAEAAIGVTTRIAKAFAIQAEELRKRSKDPENDCWPATLSIGIANRLPLDGGDETTGIDAVTSTEELIRRADDAMYSAKKDSGIAIRVYDAIEEEISGARKESVQSPQQEDTVVPDAPNAH